MHRKRMRRMHDGGSNPGEPSKWCRSEEPHNSNERQTINDANGMNGK